ncbi:unnamed protein product [Strongylus vulgaris]|uniref:Uncharacterized protein n=1 Tax=Strongylus vulgaris TaxID=40348 RepID=A0A3P7KJP5_STRVU|nr:unnamed protein product [Strongylus vulgaris]
MGVYSSRRAARQVTGRRSIWRGSSRNVKIKNRKSS